MSLRGYLCVPEVEKSQESKIVSVHEDKSIQVLWWLWSGRWRSRSDQESPSRLWCWDGYLSQIQQIEKMVGFEGTYLKDVQAMQLLPFWAGWSQHLNKKRSLKLRLSELSVTIIKFQLKCGIWWNFFFGPAPSCLTYGVECWGAGRHSTSDASGTVDGSIPNCGPWLDLGMNIHSYQRFWREQQHPHCYTNLHQLFWCEQLGTRVLTHC